MLFFRLSKVWVSLTTAGSSVGQRGRKGIPAGWLSVRRDPLREAAVVGHVLGSFNLLAMGGVVGHVFEHGDG